VPSSTGEVDASATLMSRRVPLPSRSGDC
jgi:hypothetical protein